MAKSIFSQNFHPSFNLLSNAGTWNYLLVSIDVSSVVPVEGVRAVGYHKVGDPLFHSTPALGDYARYGGRDSKVHKKPLVLVGRAGAPTLTTRAMQPKGKNKTSTLKSELIVS